jgi:hypothetical protein
MEYRSDLADILLKGLPAEERQQVVATIHQEAAETLRRKRAAGAEEGLVDVIDLDADEDDDDLSLSRRVPPQG